MRRHPTAPVNVARISVATSGTDFIAPEADFAALIRAAGLSRIDQTCLGRSGFSSDRRAIPYCVCLTPPSASPD
jgi:hypothetical protein